jgi:hypothetical protein
MHGTRATKERRFGGLAMSRNGLEGLMEAMSDQSELDFKAIVGTEREKMSADLVHIADLKTGDRLKWKGKEYKHNKIPALTQEIEVLRVFPVVSYQGKTGSPYFATEYDFTAGFEDDGGELVEYVYDSRYFARV